MADAEDVDLLKDDSADFAALESEPMAEAEAVTSAPEPEKQGAPPKKKFVRMKGTDSGSSKAKRIPIPVPPHAKGATKGPSKAAPKTASTNGPKSVTVPTASNKTARYFIMKSVSGPNVEYSIANGVWATQVCIITQPFLGGYRHTCGSSAMLVCDPGLWQLDFHYCIKLDGCQLDIAICWAHYIELCWQFSGSAAESLLGLGAAHIISIREEGKALLRNHHTLEHRASGCAQCLHGEWHAITLNVVQQVTQIAQQLKSCSWCILDNVAGG